MREGQLRRPEVGRMIAWTAGCAILCWGATLYMVRAVAQEASPPPAPQESTVDPPAADTAPDTNEDTPADPARRAAVPAPEELPEYRDSADNNISLPVDI